MATAETTMGRKKQQPERGRLELRASLDWLARLEAAATRYGLSASAYIRMAVTERMEQDERTPAPPRGKRS
jgi:hypothetical protein